MRALAARAAFALVALVPLSFAAGAAGQPRAENAYPLTAAYHFTGTPLRVATFDAGPVGRIVVTYEANVLGVVRNSFVTISTRSFDIVARAGVNRRLTEVKSFQRAGADQPKPDVGELLLQPSTAREVPGKTVLNDPFAWTRVFFAVTSSGAESLVIEPFRDGAAIPFGAAFQLSVVTLETFPIGPDGHGSEATKEEQPQPPLTPNLDEAEDAVASAKSLELLAKSAYLHKSGGRFGDLMEDAIPKLRGAKSAIRRAENTGELDRTVSLEISTKLLNAMNGDRAALNPARYRGGDWRRIKDDPAQVRRFILRLLNRALKDKNSALSKIADEKAARANGK